LKLPEISSKKILRIIGTAGLLVSLYFLVGGIYCLAQNSTAKDNDGFFSTWKFRINKDSYAVVLQSDGVDFSGSEDMGDYKVEITNKRVSNEVFIGAGGAEAVKEYLNGVNYDEITGLRIFPTRANYQNYPGTIIPSDPATQEFWINTSYGKGTHSLTWNPKIESASLVIMNKDGSPGIDMDVTVKTTIAALFTIGITNLMIGVFLLLPSLFALVYTRKSMNSVYPVPLGMMEDEKKKGKSGG
jgi:hypothetical protein